MTHTENEELIFAHTPAGTYPPYLNVKSVNPSHVGESKWKVQFTIRGEAQLIDGQFENFYTAGVTQTITVHPSVAVEIAKSILRSLHVDFHISGNNYYVWERSSRKDPAP